MEEYVLSNLKIFLERTTLTGKEVVAYAEIIKAIADAKPIKVGEE